MDITFQYPPDLFNLLIDTIPRLCRSKKDVILFFRGAGVMRSIYSEIEQQVTSAPASMTKFDIVRTILTTLNVRGEATLRERREMLKRVTEFEEFETCWDNDRLKAKGLVAEVRKLINVKDSFTRMQIERDRERRKHQEENEKKRKAEEQRRANLTAIRASFSNYLLNKTTTSAGNSSKEY